MRSLIKQSIPLPASAEDLYQTYVDPARHAKLTGAPVTVGAEPGAPFSAFEGALSGTTIACIPGKLVVQTWRSGKFGPDDPDSTLILCFSHGRIDLLHVDVPAHDYDGVTAGWEKYYWAPWRASLGPS